jgi:hypothetical protein
MFTKYEKLAIHLPDGLEQNELTLFGNLSSADNTFWIVFISLPDDVSQIFEVLSSEVLKRYAPSTVITASTILLLCPTGM